MKTRNVLTLLTLACVALLAAPPAITAQARGAGGSADGGGGQVRIPLDVYQRLLEQGRRPEGAPAPWALGNAAVRLTIEADGDRIAGTVRAGLEIEVLEDGWTLVPLLPAGTAVEEVRVDGRPIRLVGGPEGLSWSTRTAGTHRADLVYRVQAQAHAGGWSLPLPLPPCPSTNLEALLPAAAEGVTVIPGVGVESSSAGERTRVTGTIPSSTGAQIAWRSPGGTGLAVSRAYYQGLLEDDTITWSARFEVDASHGGRRMLPLLSSELTLAALAVDGEEATVHVEDDRFAVAIEGRGRHLVTATFSVPVARDEGPPRTRFAVPRVPVSTFQLEIPGDREVTVQPRAAVTTLHREDATLVTARLPLTSQVAFSWVERIPEAVRTETQAHATLYHLAHAEEGVLHMRAVAVYEITRGETRSFTLEVPRGVQVTRITASRGNLQDWRWTEEPGDGQGAVTAFLEQAVTGTFAFEVHYERLLGADPEAAERIPVPLLHARDVHRQRGMVALLSSRDLVLQPLEERSLSKVGENQLPAFVRQSVSRTVAHTYKYFQELPELVVRAAPPDRKAGKFDAQIDTLFSLGEVALKASSGVVVDVKSGSIMELDLLLPANVNVLGLTGPSLRTHQVVSEPDGQRVHVAFTREMEDRFRLELQIERILTDGEGESSGASEVPVPRLAVEGAEVEHGRIAVEALTAVEVRPLRAEHLTALDINELPRQLVLKTTNPILHAWKYVYAQPPWDLVLQVTRHRELEVQEALIETARYRTLTTRDGLAVTRASYLVRNSRRQFLRIDLPEGAEIWSVFVAGRAEKPAAAGEDDEAILVRLINSTEGFPVELVYATPVDPIGSMGTVAQRLPVPQMVVTTTRWDVYLPGGVDYRTPDTEMEILVGGNALGAAAMEERAQALRAGDEGRQPLRIAVPAKGVHFAFEKLYAGRTGEAASFRIGYASVPEWAAPALGVLAGLLLWLVPALILLADVRPPTWLGTLAFATSLALLAATMHWLDRGLLEFLATSLVCILVITTGTILRRRSTQ